MIICRILFIVFLRYSTGKTSLIKWVTGITSAFFDIRPQPSTDKFMAVVHGDEEKVINGDAATCLPKLPYSGLSRFGSSFLSKRLGMKTDGNRW